MNKFHEEFIERTLKNLKREILNPETRPSYAEIRQINKLGLLTFDSQQGLVYRSKDMPIDTVKYAKMHKKNLGKLLSQHDDIHKFSDIEWEKMYKEEVLNLTKSQYKSKGGKFHSNPVVHQKERAYLNGFAPVDMAKEVCRILNHHSSVVAYFTSFSSGPGKRNMSIPLTLALFDGNSGTASANPKFPFVSVTTAGDEFQTETLARMSGVKSPSKHPTLKRFVQITIIDTRYGHHVGRNDGLFKLVIEACKIAKKKI
jgi:hypothetical protein